MLGTSQSIENNLSNSSILNGANMFLSKLLSS